MALRTNGVFPGLRRPRVLALGLVVCATLTLSACSDADPGPQAATGQAVPGGSVTWAFEVEPDTINPQLNGQTRVRPLFLNAYESLLTRDARGGYVPLLATDYSVSDDGLVYTFTLRDDVTFSNGEALDAAAVKANFAKLNDPDYDSQAAGQGPLAKLASVDVAGPHQVTFTLTEPYSPFLAYVSSVFLVAPSAYDSPDITAGGPGVAGTGPFVIDSFTEGQEVRLVRRDDYDWAPSIAAHTGPAYLDSVTYRFLPEASVRLGALTSRQVDVIDGLGGNDVEVVKGDDRLEYQSSSTTGSPWSLYLNASAGPTQDIRVREALVAAADVDTILKSVYRGNRERAWSNVNSAEVALYDPALEGTYGNDPALANRLLDEAGWAARDSDGYRVNAAGARLTISIYTTPAFTADSHEVVLQALQAQLRQSAGFHLDIQSVDQGTWIDHFVAVDYGASDNSISGEGATALEWHWLAKEAGGAVNLSNFSDAKTEEWLAQAASSTDPAEQAEAYRALQRYVILEQFLVLPLIEGQSQIAAGRWVHGVAARPYFGEPSNLYDVWRDRA
ncbi:ABC transporter substrate-binding protein [Frankia sp. CNm7]|uniref:ABC transporter substrate-binding protein n=1 Tax=Frankia nepalensis TaxID=1836974 RepID=A0A937UU64_9ACTN|nr:ABC transporter substrate-binding protein [Frankia nepalensis]MBL7498942.1 ABC transporter substrate-binding protein [Frankia nepalensis]MBL7511261.1 ABC transporter substrate-binding protein [Frankia nepalensis]MBL7520565.1 ABC transporter substrate-binding protein [Frankia nepalensis]MBL7630781.1 ABC transporter substrate-binding protein [Frankia nepalensis]